MCFLLCNKECRSSKPVLFKLANYLVRPIKVGAFVIYFLAKASNHLRRRPNILQARKETTAGHHEKHTWILMSLEEQDAPINVWLCLIAYLGGLFQQHLVEDRHDPVLELAVVVIGHQQVSYPVKSSGPQQRSGQSEVASVGWRKAFDEVLLYTSSSRNNNIHLNRNISWQN